MVMFNARKLQKLQWIACIAFASTQRMHKVCRQTHYVWLSVHQIKRKTQNIEFEHYWYIEVFQFRIYHCITIEYYAEW